MARPRNNPDRVDTRERILSAAEGAFGGRGYRASRLEDIASEAGIRRPSLLYHFSSKRALYEAVVERAFHELGRAVEEGMRAGEGFLDRIEATTDALVTFARRRPGVPSLVLRELIDVSSSPLATDALGALVDTLEAHIRREGADVVPEHFPVRSAVLSLLMSHLVRAAAGDAAQALWRGEEATTALLRGMMLGAALQPGDPHEH